MTAKSGAVYVLKDPESGEPKYIGATINDVEYRRDQHVRKPSSKVMEQWIDSLDEKPTVEKLTTTAMKKLGEKEQEYIDKYSENHEILNGEAPRYTGHKRTGVQTGYGTDGININVSDTFIDDLKKVAKACDMSDQTYAREAIRQKMLEDWGKVSDTQLGDSE